MDITKTIIPLALMAYESIAHSAFGLMGYCLRAHFGLDEVIVKYPDGFDSRKLVFINIPFYRAKNPSL